MEIEFQSGSPAEIRCDMLVFPVFAGEKAASGELAGMDKASRRVLSKALETGEFKTGLNQTLTIHRPAGMKAARLLFLGAGEKSEFTLATLRLLAGAATRAACAASCRSVAMVRRSEHAPSEAARAASEGILLGQYNSEIYKTEESNPCKVEKFSLVSRQRLDASLVSKGVREGTIVGESINLVRTLVNEPSNILTPTEFAERASDIAGKIGLGIEVLEQEEIQKLGMNTLLAVSRGSAEPPKLVVLRLPGTAKKTRKRMPLHAFIGKGVTFDSGGISIKPADRMEEMKGDMAGGAVVLGTMAALAQLRPQRRVMGIIPLVENLPSGTATKPGDVVRSLSGKTVEIINTDAEGRLILADAITHARNFGATHLLDIATLTGACVVALGRVRAGMMGTDRKTIEKLRKNETITGEKFWELPLDDDYRKLIRSEIADVKNVGPRGGGAITAAKFLQEFADKTPWVHLDIAGMELDSEPRPYLSKGATGFGVRSLIQLVE